MCQAMNIFALALLATFCVSTQAASVADDEFPNYNEFGADWGGTCDLGVEQSPLNIVTDEMAGIVSPDLKADIRTLGTVKGVKVYLTDKLNTVKVTWKEFVVEPSVFVPATSFDGSTFVTFDKDAEAMAASKKVAKVPIEALQFHFHTPSEEAINGKRSAADLHIVHHVKPGFSAACDRAGGCLVVLGVLLDFGADSTLESEVLKPFLTTPFNKSGEENGIEFGEDFEFNLDDLLPKNRDYMTWPGSLTTPPCTEGVLWLLFKDSMKISESQVQCQQESVAFAEGPDCEEMRDGKCYPPRQMNNARPLQPMNERKVKSVEF